MNPIKADLYHLFQNETVLEIFSNSDGQGLIYTAEIERKLSIDEILELEEKTFNPEVIIFINKYKDYPNLQNFIKFFQQRIREISNLYRDAAKMERAIEIAANNLKEISKRYPDKSKLDACREFITLYQQKHKELGSQSFDRIKDFFINPIDWV